MSDDILKEIIKKQQELINLMIKAKIYDLNIDVPFDKLVNW